jgi:hypothetical protein
MKKTWKQKSKHTQNLFQLDKAHNEIERFTKSERERDAGVRGIEVLRSRPEVACGGAGSDSGERQSRWCSGSGLLCWRWRKCWWWLMVVIVWWRDDVDDLWLWMKLVVMDEFEWEWIWWLVGDGWECCCCCSLIMVVMISLLEMDGYGDFCDELWRYGGFSGGGGWWLWLLMVYDDGDYVFVRLKKENAALLLRCYHFYFFSFGFWLLSRCFFWFPSSSLHQTRVLTYIGLGFRFMI